MPVTRRGRKRAAPAADDGPTQASMSAGLYPVVLINKVQEMGSVETPTQGDPLLPEDDVSQNSAPAKDDFSLQQKLDNIKRYMKNMNDQHLENKIKMQEAHQHQLQNKMLEAFLHELHVEWNNQTKKLEALQQQLEMERQNQTKKLEALQQQLEMERQNQENVMKKFECIRHMMEEAIQADTQP